MSIDSAGSTTAEHAVSVDSVPASASSSLPSSTPLTTEGGSTAATPLAAVSSTVVSAIVDSVKALISSSTTTTTTTSTTTSNPTTTSFASTFSTKSSSSSSSSSTSPLHEKIDVADLSSSLQHFGIVDYCVFILMLVVCAVIGFYFGFIEKKKKSAKKDATIDNAERRGSEALDYLVGGRKMKVFPVSLSLVASFVSGVSLLGTSTEIYVYGTQYAFILITLALSGLISWYIFLPVFCNLQLTSTYEYFEMRFGRGIRSLGAVLFIVGMVLWLPVAIYVPAITFNQVTGIGIHVITPIVCIICTFYTCLGGLKAVIWTDVIQSFVMYGSILAVCIKGTIDVGGIDVVWQRNADGGRLNAPAYTWDPTVRLSMASVLIGGTLHKIQSSAVNQISIQRYLSLPSYKKARQAMFLFTILLTFLLLCCAYVGLVSFATFYDCDPLTTKLARASDQLPSLLMMLVLGSYPGLPGLFVAGVFSAALSSLSTGLNSLACVISQDIINPFIKRKLSERNTAIILRLIVIFFGLGCIGLVVVVEKLGMVLELSSMTGAVTMGPLLGVYTMGVCLPWINGKSAIFGSLVSFLTMSWICAHAQLAQMNGEIRYLKLPVSVEGCTYTFDNSTLLEMQNYRPNTAEERNIYHLSFLWYASSGFGICVVAASLSSLVFGGTNLEELDPALITPCMRRFLPKKNYQVVGMEELFQHKELSTSATATALEKLNIDKDIKE